MCDAARIQSWAESERKPQGQHTNWGAVRAWPGSNQAEGTLPAQIPVPELTNVSAVMVEFRLGLPRRRCQSQLLATSRSVRGGAFVYAGASIPGGWGRADLRPGPTSPTLVFIAAN